MPMRMHMHMHMAVINWAFNESLLFFYPSLGGTIEFVNPQTTETIMMMHHRDDASSWWCIIKNQPQGSYGAGNRSIQSKIPSGSRWERPKILSSSKSWQKSIKFLDHTKLQKNMFGRKTWNYGDFLKRCLPKFEPVTVEFWGVEDRLKFGIRKFFLLFLQFSPFNL